MSLLFIRKDWITQTNKEIINDLQNRKRELLRQIKDVEKNLAIYNNYTNKLYDHKQSVIEEQLLDVYNQENSEDDIKIKLTKNPDYLQIHLIKDNKEKFDNDIKNISKYLNNLKKTFNSLPKQFPTYDHVSNIRITKHAIEIGIFRFTYCEGFHTKYNIKLEFLENERLQYTMTKYTDGYSFEQIPKTNHHFKIKSESYENKLNIEYSIKAESTFDNLEQSLKETFMEIEDEFKNITIEID